MLWGNGMLRWLLVLVGLFGFVACAAAQAAEKRVALIIGNDDYQVVRPKLENAGNDARAMERGLKAAGFETTLGFAAQPILLWPAVRHSSSICRRSTRLISV